MSLYKPIYEECNYEYKHAFHWNETCEGSFRPGFFFSHASVIYTIL